MTNNNNFGKWYLKYVVKNPILFCGYLGVFLIVLLVLTINFQLEERQTFEAEINENEIVVWSEVPIKQCGDKVYVYRDRNQEVLLYNVKETGYSDGVLSLFLQENSQGISGKVTVEIVTDSRTLLERIFS